MAWREGLKTFMDLYLRSNLSVEWIVVGSVGSVLQGAEMTPNDLDIFTKEIEGVRRLADMLKPFEANSKSELSHSDANWLSSSEERCFTQSFPSGFQWTKGKWKIHDFGLEVVHISNSAGIPDSEEGDGVWEGGKYFWTYAKNVIFEDYVIPIVPLEIQLESNLRRQRQDRVDAIISALKREGYTKELLKKGLSRKNYQIVQELLH